MGVPIRLCGIWFQAIASISSENTEALNFLVGIVALSLAIEVIAVAFIALGAARTERRVSRVANEICESVLPVAHSLQELVCEINPKIQSISDNLLETNHLVRAQKLEIHKTLSNANQKARVQAANINALISTSREVSSGLASAYPNLRTQMREASGVIMILKTEFGGLVARVKS